MNAPTLRRRAGGFTLVEAITAIVLLGILGAIVAVFIRAPIRNYADARARTELTDLGDLALRRIARDLRLGLPNSVRLSGTSTLEFLLTKTGGRYLTLEDASASGTPLDFGNTANVTFSVLGPLDQVGRRAISSGAAAIGTDLLVINNQGTDANHAPANAYLLTGAQRNIAYIRSVDFTSPTMPLIQLWDNPFAAQAPLMPSESARFQVVSGPVTYHCVPGAAGGGALYRQWNYAITAAQAVPPVAITPTPPSYTGPQSQMLIDRVLSCSFDYQLTKSGRGGLVTLSMRLQAPNNGDDIYLVHQIHLDNTP
jgi:MSHA biogenesis protein MshO